VEICREYFFTANIKPFHNFKITLIVKQFFKIHIQIKAITIHVLKFQKPYICNSQKNQIIVAGNSFGQLFKITTFGESHGKAIGVIIDGCPAGLEIDEAFIQSELARRRPGQSAIVTQRKEGDEAQILSGIFEGKSTGTPISMVIYNQDQRSKDYSHIKIVIEETWNFSYRLCESSWRYCSFERLSKF